MQIDKLPKHSAHCKSVIAGSVLIAQNSVFSVFIVLNSVFYISGMFFYMSHDVVDK